MQFIYREYSEDNRTIALNKQQQNFNCPVSTDRIIYIYKKKRCKGLIQTQ